MMADGVALLSFAVRQAVRRPKCGSGGVLRPLSMLSNSHRQVSQPHGSARPSSSLGSLNYAHVAPDPLADPGVFDDINTYSCKRQTGVSLKTLLDTGE